MNYSKGQLEAIEKVKNVFADYIKNSRTLELLWSDKLGYILITGISKNMDDIAMQPEIIEDASRLCDQLLYEIACDVLEAIGNIHDIYESSPLEEKLIKEAYQPYMHQLPEYSDLIDLHFTDPEYR